MASSQSPRRSIRPATPADVPAIARVHVEAWRETYPGMLPAFVLDALTYAEREEQWYAALERGGACLCVAERDGEIVGFASGGPNREDGYPEYPGELWTLYLLRSAQRGGLGRALFESVRDWLRAHELEPFMVWVIAANPACAFYERFGATRIVTQESEIRGARVLDCIYAWPKPAPEGSAQPEAGISWNVEGST